MNQTSPAMAKDLAGKSHLSDFDIYCIHSFFATLCVEGDGITFADVVNQTANVNKDFLFRGVVNDEAKSF